MYKNKKQENKTSPLFNEETFILKNTQANLGQ